MEELLRPHVTTDPHAHVTRLRDENGEVINEVLYEPRFRPKALSYLGEGVGGVVLAGIVFCLFSIVADPVRMFFLPYFYVPVVLDVVRWMFRFHMNLGRLGRLPLLYMPFCAVYVTAFAAPTLLDEVRGEFYWASLAFSAGTAQFLLASKLVPHSFLHHIEGNSLISAETAKKWTTAFTDPGAFRC